MQKNDIFKYIRWNLKSSDECFDEISQYVIIKVLIMFYVFVIDLFYEHNLRIRFVVPSYVAMYQ